jgi:hypothetical protein
MVGNEKGNGHICGFHPSLRCSPECGGFGKARVGFLECRAFALASKSCTNDADAKDQAAAQAAAAAGLPNQRTGGPLSMEGPTGASFGEVFLNWLVHR